MSYLNVIPRTEAKTHLGVDDTYRDAEIDRMIKTCLSKVESDTNHLVYARDKDFIYSDDCVRVYDYPINSTTSTTHEVEVKEGYSVYSDSNNDTITLNVGYSDVAAVPSGLKDMALILLEQLFHKGEMKMTDEYNFWLGQFKRFYL